MIPLLRLMGLLLALASAGSAAAHSRSESHATWLIDGSVVRLTFSVEYLEAQRLSHGEPSSDRTLVAYLDGKERVTAGGKPCSLVAPAHPVAAAPGFHRVEMRFKCATADAMVLHSAAFFDIVPTHVNVAHVETASGDFAEYLLTAEKQDIEVDRVGGAGLEGVGFFAFVEMGIMHIFTGVDHMLFLLGLVLISRGLRDLTFVVTGFTLGHSLTLALAFTGVIRPHAEFIDALVALTIALIGIENVSSATRRPGLLALWTGGALVAMGVLRLAGVGLLPPLLLFGAGLFASNYLMVAGYVRDAGRLRLLVTLVFGLIHGFGFAADLLSEPMPAGSLAKLLVGFNLGVEIGQLTLVLGISLAVYVLSRFKLSLPRPIVVDVTAALLVGIGTLWFVQRSFA